MPYLTDAAMGKKKQKATAGFLIFLIFMLACTVISRGIYAYRMPQVTVGRAGQKSLSHTVTATGTVEGIRETAVLAEPGVRVSEICVKEGDAVEKGTVLMRLSLSDLKELEEEAKEQVEAAKERLASLEAAAQAQEKAAQNARSRAKSDLSRTKKNQNAAVSSAQNAYNKAKKEKDALPSWKKYRDQVRNKDARYRKLYQAAKKKGATKEDKAAFKEYQAELDGASRSEWEMKKQTLKETAAALAQALKEAKTARSEAVLAAERAVEDASVETVTDESAMTEAKGQIRQAEKTRAAYRKLIAEGGEIKSGIEGAVARMVLSVGDRTADGAAMILTDSAGGWNFRASLTEEEAKYVNEGDTVSVTLQGNKKADEDASVLSIAHGESGEAEVLLRLSQEKAYPGQSGILNVTRQSGPYSCCVPLSALYADNNKNYLLLLRETQTILGTELHLVRRDVEIQDRNAADAALADGSVGEEEVFVLSSSKAVLPGDTVRYMEEDNEAD